jgi:exodeoxyribonuclease VII large subunit
MKQSQLDIFGGEAPPKSRSKKKAARKPTEKRRRKRDVKKARMLIDAYDASGPTKASPPPEKAEIAEQPVAAKAASPHIYTVSEITERIKGILEGEYPDVWLCGEITDFKGRVSRNLYFSLKDERKNKIRIAIFNADQRTCPFELKDGLEVICHGRLNVWGQGGYYSIIVDHIEPKGIGALQLAFEQLKAKLKAEGLFDEPRKKRLPFLPKKIGIVTSETGAAIRDIIHVLTRRFPNIEILLIPVKVQGDGAAADIAGAIALMNMRSDIDLMIVGRGGGSIEDLWAFNEEAVARAISASRIPVISAVGHEIDFTIADFVADVRAPTPSAAAEIAVPVKAQLVLDIAAKRERLSLSLKNAVTRKHHDLARLAARLPDPSRRIPDLMRTLDGLSRGMRFGMNALLTRHSDRLAKFASNLDHLSPLGILAKGYSVAEDARGRVVTSSKNLRPGADLRLRFHEGGANARVTKIIDE